MHVKQIELVVICLDVCKFLLNLVLKIVNVYNNYSEM